MENWVIAGKFSILLYCIVKFITGDMRSGPLVLFLMLAYVSLAMPVYVLHPKKARMLFLTVSGLVLLFSAVFIQPFFFFLLPLQLAELTYTLTKNEKLSFVPPAAASVIVGREALPEYLVIGLLSILLYMLAAKMYKKLAEAKDENVLLREENDRLYARLDKGTDFENQLRHLSQLDERNSIAQKIHDRVGHALAGSLIQLEAAKALMGSDPGKAGEIIGNVSDVLREGMESIRSTLRSIKPAPEQLGIHRLKVMLNEFSLHHLIKTSLVFNGSLERISHLQWKVITENLKEALTNTLKYSHADCVTVTIEVLNRLVKFEVRDNGIGAPAIKKGLGLKGMEERTGSAGGKLIVDGSKGFSVITLLPNGGEAECQ